MTASAAFSPAAALELGCGSNPMPTPDTLHSAIAAYDPYADLQIDAAAAIAARDCQAVWNTDFLERVALLPIEQLGALRSRLLGAFGRQLCIRDWNKAINEKQTLLNARSTATGATDRGIVAELSDRIRAADHFAQDAGRRLQRFRGGVYAPDADEHVRRRVLVLLPELGAEKRFSRNLCAEVSEHIRIQAPMLWDRPPMDTLNCANGLLDLTTRELRPHDPAHLSAVQLPVSFDPAATCTAWELFISTTFPDDAAALGFEILGWLAVPYLSLQKAVLALGPGGNGKSIYLSAVTGFIGRRNCAAMSLHSLESDRFAAARLMGKLVNICPDLPSAYLESTSVFKAIVGGDRIPAEYKFHDGFDFEPFARLLFSANHPPKSGDSSEGFFRRWVVLPFEKTFSPDRPGYVPRDALLAWLTGATELSGALNRALDALPHVLKGGFTDSESVRQAAEDFRAATDHFSVWLELATVDHPAAWIPMATLAAAYNAACERAGRPPMNKQQFGRALKRARPEVRDSRRMTDSRQILGYQGIGLREQSEVIQ